MNRYLILLPGPEQEWAALPPTAHDAAMLAHEQFRHRLAERGHQIVTASPLTPSERAVTLRPEGDGGVLVTDGPYAQTTEQIVGFYLIDSPDERDLLEVCRELARSGDPMEIRRLARDEPVEADIEEQAPGS